MANEDLVLLQYLIRTENISVEYYNDGKTYLIPANSVIDEKQSTVPDIENSTVLFQIDCKYFMAFGMPFLDCNIDLVINDDTVDTFFKTKIPLNQTKHTSQQYQILSLLNTCANKIIAQEQQNFKKYALTTAFINNKTKKEYS